MTYQLVALGNNYGFSLPEKIAGAIPSVLRGFGVVSSLLTGIPTSDGYRWGPMTTIIDLPDISRQFAVYRLAGSLESNFDPLPDKESKLDRIVERTAQMIAPEGEPTQGYIVLTNPNRSNIWTVKAGDKTTSVWVSKDGRSVDVSVYMQLDFLDPIERFREDIGGQGYPVALSPGCIITVNYLLNDHIHQNFKMQFVENNS